MADMPAARPSPSRRVHHGSCGCSFLAAVAAVLQQHSRFACCLSARRRVHHGSCNCSLLAAVAAVLQQHGRYACCSTARRKAHHGSCGCSLLAAVAAVLQQHGRYACCSQPAGEFIIMAVLTLLSSQQWQLFFSSMADMPAARQNAGEFNHGSCGCPLLGVHAAVLQQHGRYVCCLSERRRVHHGSCGCSLLATMPAALQNAGEFIMAVVTVLSSVAAFCSHLETVVQQYGSCSGMVKDVFALQHGSYIIMY